MAAKVENPDPTNKGPEDNKGDDQFNPNPNTDDDKKDSPEMTEAEKAAYAAGQAAALAVVEEERKEDAKKVAAALVESKAKVSKKRFIEFEYDDPFIKGATRAYYPDGIPNPFTLLKSDRNAVEILAGYIVRSTGGCRPDLAALAEAALQKASAV